MNVTTIETPSKQFALRIAGLLVTERLEFDFSPDSVFGGYTFLVKCSRTNHELFTLASRIDRVANGEKFEVRGYANLRCQSARSVTLIKGQFHPYGGACIHPDHMGDMPGDHDNLSDYREPV